MSLWFAEATTVGVSERNPATLDRIAPMCGASSLPVAKTRAHARVFVLVLGTWYLVLGTWYSLLPRPELKGDRSAIGQLDGHRLPSAVMAQGGDQLVHGADGDTIDRGDHLAHGDPGNGG